MKEIAKPAAVKAKNYTAKQEQAIRDAAPLDLDKAKALAESMGKTWRSIVAKALSLEVEYISKPAPAKRPHQTTKAELVRAIADGLGVDGLRGLEKATGGALARLYDAIVTLHAEMRKVTILEDD